MATGTNAITGTQGAGQYDLVFPGGAQGQAASSGNDVID